jgi:hypothetical protein
VQEQSITTLQTSVGDTNTSLTQTQTVVTEVQGDVANIKAEWAVEINGNGQVIGLVKLDSIDAQATFTVVADKFIVANPTASNDTVQVFVVGQVDGQGTVGIDGNLLVDGTILARSIAAGTITADKIDVDALSAISADIGTVTAGRLQSADGKFIIDMDSKFIQITT